LGDFGVGGGDLAQGEVNVIGFDGEHILAHRTGLVELLSQFLRQFFQPSRHSLFFNLLKAYAIRSGDSPIGAASPPRQFLTRSKK